MCHLFSKQVDMLCFCDFATVADSPRIPVHGATLAPSLVEDFKIHTTAMKSLTSTRKYTTPTTTTQRLAIKPDMIVTKTAQALTMITAAAKDKTLSTKASPSGPGMFTTYMLCLLSIKKEWVYVLYKTTLKLLLHKEGLKKD